MKRAEIWFGGIGGQGVVYAANLLGQAASAVYPYVAATAHYGPESRGGLTSAELIISDAGTIDYPYIESPNMLVIMHQRSVADIPKDLTALTHIIYDSTLVSDMPLRALNDIGAKQSHPALIPVPATQLARERFDNIQMANLILLGALVKAAGIVTPEALLSALKSGQADAKQAIELGFTI
jgi:2-oxoglutarate ferredoxin oxidoreductase subunit gamma